ncbi:MAG: N-acetyltransferase family protein [Pseudomonadota bacterium]
MSEIEVVACEQAHMPAITAIYGASVVQHAASFELEPPDVDEMLRRRERLLADGYPYLVALRAESVVGYGYASAYRPRPAYAGTVEHSVYVAEDARRCGVGSALLTAVTDACGKAGFRQMIAVIGDPEVGASVAFHAAHGFRQVGRVEGVGRKFGRDIDCVLMQRGLRADQKTTGR